MTFYAKMGDNYFPTNNNISMYDDVLPPGVYTLMQSLEGFYFQINKEFDIPKVLYGDDIKNVNRVINTFNDRKKSTGVLLSGEKGSGKTLFAQILSSELMKNGLPTIIINSPFSGDSFNSLLNKIEQPCVVFFDEFEKTYNNNESQNQLLTVFDGVYSSKKLFVVTSNEVGKINSYMINRPGRFYYKFSYSGLNESFIRDYVEKNLKNKNNIESFVRFAISFRAFNFDMLQALTEEMNRYNETANEAVKYMNIDLSGNYITDVYNVKTLIVNDKKIDIPDKDVEFNGGGRFSPIFSGSSYLSVYLPREFLEFFPSGESVSEVDEEDNTFNFYQGFSPQNIVSINGDNVVYRKDGVVVEIEKKQYKQFDYKSLYDL